MKRKRLAISDFPALQLCAALKIVREPRCIRLCWSVPCSYRLPCTQLKSTALFMDPDHTEVVY